MDKIIYPKKQYTYEQLCQDSSVLKDRYPTLIRVKTIGYSVDQRKILAIQLGTGKDNILLSGAHHAREWLTTPLLMDMIETYAHAAETRQSFRGFEVKTMLEQCCFWFIPMVNPDGVTLVQLGASQFEHQEDLLRWNNYSEDFTAWKANIRGVDLNRQYPVDWETIKSDPGEPSFANFKGVTPLSEPESKAIYQFIQSKKIKIAAAYHSSGEEIFWKYKSTAAFAIKSEQIAMQLAELTGYKLIYPGDDPSGGGLTDWFISHYRQPSFTIEIAPYIGPNPVPLHHYDQIYQANKYVPFLLAVNRDAQV
ncbi:M14 family metallopeptidase [Paraliobacillus ryukyuensis]|uniref:M14 family metallopeptidase n=1 Tax=Paraliobacillus ryukyuensis TaxID=200904 RepID=UPI0009A607FE|nr:M14 family metallocarboxypeptidase [Paraliobacillus ryukyuensis]